MKKRLLIAALACVLVCVSPALLASCGEEAPATDAPTNQGSTSNQQNNQNNQNNGQENPPADPCANGHTEVIDEAVAATCIETGLTEGKHCSACNTVLVAQTETPLIDHNYVNRICTGCGDVLYSQGLEFVFDGYKSCTVKGLGTCTDTDLYIPPTSPEGWAVTAIEEAAFQNCTHLTSVLIPDSILRVGRYAFEGCANLIKAENGVSYVDKWAIGVTLDAESLSLREDTVGIADWAFANHYTLSGIVLPNTLKAIGDRAFYCLGLTAFTIPEGVEYVGDGAFYECNNLVFNEYENGCYIGKSSNPYYMLIKAKSTDITSCKIHENTRFIQYYAFHNCMRLESITVPGSVKRIGNNAFLYCPSLASVAISEGVESIGDSAFAYSSLAAISFPKSLTDLGISVFSNSEPLSITVAVGNPRYHAQGNCLIETATKTLVLGCKNSEIPTDGSVTRIGNYAFYNCRRIKSLTIPNCVTSVGNYAFSGCYGFETFIFPDSVTELGDGVLADCANMKSVVLPKYITRIGDYALSGGRIVKNIEIPSGVTSIGKGAFSACMNLTSITIPEGVTKIEDSTFSNCNSLTEINLPSTLKSIGAYAFERCEKLETLSIPAGVTSIGDHAFYYCTSLSNLTIPDTVTDIDNYAFDCCYQLFETENGVHYVGKWVVGCDRYATTATLKDTVIGIASSAFEGCTKLKTITIPNGVTYIGDSAFADCTALTSITIPAGVTYIGDSAFKNCKALTNITIPAGVTSIGYQTFCVCQALTAIIIPEGVTSIGDSAFFGCKGLTSITLPNSLISIGDSAFCSCEKLASITLPKGLTSIGESAFGWCKGLTSITLPNSLISIGDSAFCYCSGLANITLPSSVTSIGKSAFEIVNLTSIIVEEGNAVYHSDGNCLIDTKNKILIAGCQTSVIPTNGSVTSIGENAFRNCVKLKSIIIPDSVTHICNSAFENCRELESITIPESVINLGNYAFASCDDLKNITIPKSVIYIGSYAFSNLKTITYQGTVAEWNAITNGYRWNSGVSAFEVICTDGTVKVK